MTLSIADLFVQPTLVQAKESVTGIARAAGLIVTDWVLGSPSERWVEISARVIDGFLSAITAQAIRGFFLDVATDPGDTGDPNTTPGGGWLSALGEGWYGTTRRGQTFASGTVTIRNDSLAPATFRPFDLTFERDHAAADGGVPTYRNDLDEDTYQGLGGTLTLAVGASVAIPVLADQIGSYSTALDGEIDTVVTNSFGTLTIADSTAAIGSEREDADLYRARCRQAPAVTSPGGPGEAYRRAATTAKDGTPLARHDGTGSVGITRSQIIPTDVNGHVFVFLADADGAADTTDVDSAEANILGVALGVITDPIGVVPDCVTCDVVAAAETSIHVVGSMKIKHRPGLDDASLAAAVKAAIVAALAANFSTFDIGGIDGKIYTGDLLSIADGAYPGTYNPLITTPAGADTTILAGHVPTVDSDAADWTVTVVP